MALVVLHCIEWRLYAGQDLFYLQFTCQLRSELEHSSDRQLIEIRNK